ncbi:MAG: hypothetical protein MJY86_05035 [Bacteroidales bacterium]|nr:hypothetical protein [Bacteroidales bacterium]MCQ2162623.1 hypothetical protein [Bacteroidales bacterium]
MARILHCPAKETERTETISISIRKAIFLSSERIFKCKARIALARSREGPRTQRKSPVHKETERSSADAASAH